MSEVEKQKTPLPNEVTPENAFINAFNYCNACSR